MKAILYRTYGPPRVLRYEDIARPAPKFNEVLLKVRAAALNPLDWHFMRGLPYLVRVIAGLRQPKFPGLGVDVSGVVETVGKNVTQFKPGDEVFGSCRGAFAEYVTTTESELVTKPAHVTFDQAAAIPVAAFTALQGLRDKAHIQPGHKILVNGASGGVGTFAVQIAKSYGAEVTGVCSTLNLEMVRSIGADHVIDYTKENFTGSGQHYDIILDAVGNHSLAACRRALTPKGTLVMAGGKAGRWMVGPIARGIAASALSSFGSQKFASILAKGSQQDLTVMRDLLQTGKVTPVIDRLYKLRDIAQAFSYLEEGHARGKIVIIP